jgi:hypothetical protein
MQYHIHITLREFMYIAVCYCVRCAVTVLMAVCGCPAVYAAVCGSVVQCGRVWLSGSAAV